MLSRSFMVCAFLCFATIFVPAGSALAQGTSGSNGDPTRPNSSTGAALEALRRASGNNQDDQDEEDEISVIGVVIAGGEESARGMVILKIDDSIFPAIEGQTVRTGEQNVTIGKLNLNMVELVDPKRGSIQQVFFGSNRGVATEEGQVALIELSSVPLFLAAQALSYVTNTQITATVEAQIRPITLFLRDVTVDEVLSSIAATHHLYSSTIRDSGIIRFQTVEEFARGSAALQDQHNQVFTLRFPNARDIALTIRDLYGDRVRLSERVDESEESGEFLTDDLEQRLERFDIIAGRSQGLGVGDQGGQGGTIVGSNRLSSLRNNQNNSLRNFNQRTDQSSTQGEFEFTDEEIRRLGLVDDARIDAIRDSRADIFVSIIDRLNKLLVRTRDERTMSEIEELVEDLDEPAQLVFLEIRILRVQLDDGLDTAFNWAFSEGDGAGIFLPTDPEINGSLLFSYLDSSFAAEIRFLQDKDKLTVLGQPSLLTTNNEVSRIFIGEQVPVLVGFGDNTTIVTDLGNTVNFANAEYEDQDVGSTLLITPNINDDDTVELRLLQEESQIVRNGANVLVPNGDGGFDERPIDIVAAQTVSGTFVAANSRTFAIGGLITESIEDQISQIPLLGDLPLIGRLFRNQATTRRRDEIVLLVTPTIINNPDAGELMTRDFVERQSLFPNPMPEDGNLDVFEESDVLVPGVPEKNDAAGTINSFFRGQYGPRK
ncbi:MAG: hypothetical protein AAGJ81_12375 [Verrucomicrobiota bacterium]